MVRAGAFKFELVEAETKHPFKEFAHARKVYVEAEPGAEYFLSIQKVDKTERNVFLQYSVDGKKINCGLIFRKKCISKLPSYRGLRTVENGVSRHTSLEFVKPKFSDSTDSSRGLMMGKVDIKISEFQFKGRMRNRCHNNSKSNFEVATVDVNGETTSKKKNLRSAEGTINTKNKTLSAMEPEIIVGKHLDTSKFGVII